MPPEPCTWLAEHPEALGERPPPAHLATCAHCRTRLDGLEQAFDPPPVPFPPALEARILAAVAARSGKPRR